MPVPGFLLYNASAGSAAKHPPEQLLEILREDGSQVDFHEFAEGDVPEVLAREAVERGARWVAVAGGDGTIENAAKALLGTDVPLGIIPCGTFNNFALSTGIPADPIEACRCVVRRKSRPIDVGYVNGHPFFECVGIGLDAALFPVGEEIKSGGLHRWIEFLRRAYRYNRERLEIQLDEPIGDAVVEQEGADRHLIKHLRALRHRHLRLRVLLVTVSNGPYYGANFTVAPSARIDDGKLTVSIFKRFNKLSLWWHFLSISSGRRAVSPELVSLRTPKLKILGNKRLPVHFDGSPLDEWPLEFTIRRANLRVFSSGE